MKTLRMIMAAGIAAAVIGCAPQRQSIPTQTVVGIPTARAERTQFSRDARASYTFPLKVDGQLTCAHYNGMYDNQSTEYGAMVIGLAEKNQQQVRFESYGVNGQGCHEMASGPELVPERLPEGHASPSYTPKTN